MTSDEVDVFMDLFSEHFPDVGEWLRKQSGKTIAYWQSAFRSLSFDVARSVLPGFLRGDLEWPKTWGQWPAEIAKRCRSSPVTTRRPPLFVDGHFAVACLTCGDSGWVTCWHPVSVAAMVALVRGPRGDEKPFGARMTRYTCAVRCSCEAGQRWQSVPVIYDESRWVYCEGVSHQPSVDRLREFAESRGDIRRHRGYTDFGEYSGN